MSPGFGDAALDFTVFTHAAFTVLVTRRFLLAALNFRSLNHAGFVVLMAFAFLPAASQVLGLYIAILCMYVLHTGQLPLLEDEAIRRVFMDFRLRIAAVRVLMHLNFRQSAPQVSVFVKASRIVPVNHKVRISANQISFAVITGIVMLMDIQSLDGAHRFRV